MQGASKFFSHYRQVFHRQYSAPGVLRHNGAIALIEEVRSIRFGFDVGALARRNDRTVEKTPYLVTIRPRNSLHLAIQRTDAARKKCHLEWTSNWPLPAGEYCVFSMTMRLRITWTKEKRKKPRRSNAALVCTIDVERLAAKPCGERRTVRGAEAISFNDEKRLRRKRIRRGKGWEETLSGKTNRYTGRPCSTNVW